MIVLLSYRNIGEIFTTDKLEHIFVFVTGTFYISFYIMARGYYYDTVALLLFPFLFRDVIDTTGKLTFLASFFAYSDSLQVKSHLIGASLSEPHHVRSTVKFVFFLACLLVCLYACHRLIWLSATKSTLKAI